MTDEHVYVVPRRAVLGRGRLVRAPDRRPRRSSSPRSSATAGTSRGPRWSVDPSFKQVIPYLVLRDGRASS